MLSTTSSSHIINHRITPHLITQHPAPQNNVLTMKLSLALLLISLATSSAFSPSSRNALLRDLREMSMAPAPGTGRGGAAEPEYSNSGAFLPV